jgi:hypothetical protein
LRSVGNFYVFPTSEDGEPTSRQAPLTNVRVSVQLNFIASSCLVLLQVIYDMCAVLEFYPQILNGLFNHVVNKIVFSGFGGIIPCLWGQFSSLTMLMGSLW